MPVARQQYDFSLNGKGFILAREKSQRAWSRTGIPDVAQHMLAVDIRRGYLDPIVNRPDVWNDWSGGFGDAYRDASHPNRYHWSENFEPRFPFQLVHCQQLNSPLNAPQNNNFIDGMVVAPPSAAFISPVMPYGDGLLIAAGTTGSSTTTPALSMIEVFAPRVGDSTGLTSAGAYGNATTYCRRPAVFGSYIYLGVAEATGFYSVPLGTPGPSFGPMPGRIFHVAGSRLWRAHGPNAGDAIYLQSCAAGADPMATGNWSATLSVGRGGNILDLCALNDQLYVGMADGLYAGDQSGTFYNVLPHLAGRVHPDNCRDLCAWGPDVVAPTTLGVYAYRPSLFGGQRGEARDISPVLGSNRSVTRGYVRCVTSYGGWLYGGLWTGSQSWLLAGSERAQGQVAWHTLQRLRHPEKVNRLLVDGITAGSGSMEFPPRLWVASEGSYSYGTSGATAGLYYIPIPPGDRNPLNVPAGSFTANYCGSARMDLGITDGGVPGVPKVYRAFEVWSEGLSGTAGGQWCDIYYALDGSAFTYLDTAATSPYSILYFPSNAGSFTTGQGIEISLRSFTASAGVTPVYRAFTLRSALRPNSIDMIEARALIGDGLRDRYGHEMRDGKTMILDLRQFAVGASPVTLIDLAGAASQVMVMAPIDEQEVWQEGDERPQLIATVRMAALQYTRGVAA